jgi:hypothetical protein
MESFTEVQLESIHAVVDQLRGLSEGQAFRFAEKLNSLDGPWTAAYAIKCKQHFEIQYDDTAVEVKNKSFDDEDESLMAPHLWEIGWFGVPTLHEPVDSGGKTCPHTYTFEGNSFNMSLNDEKVTLHPVVSKCDGEKEIVFTIKSLVGFPGDDGSLERALFFFAAENETNTSDHKAVIFNIPHNTPQIVDLDRIQLFNKDGGDSTPDYDVSACQEIVRAFLKEGKPSNVGPQSPLAATNAAVVDLTLGKESNPRGGGRKISVNRDTEPHPNKRPKRPTLPKKVFSPNQDAIKLLQQSHRVNNRKRGGTEQKKKAK